MSHQFHPINVPQQAAVQASSVSRKRKRGASGAVLDAAQRQGNPAQSALIDAIQNTGPGIRVTANNQLYIPNGRSGSKHLWKVSPGIYEKRATHAHAHDVFSKYNRHHQRNGIKAHKAVYAPQ